MRFNFTLNRLFLLCFTPLFLRHSIAVDILKAGQSFNDTQIIVSADEKFELGFFTHSKSSDFKYLGIWYKSLPDYVVWVANRDNPILNSSATLKFNTNGNLILVNQTGQVFWSSNSTSLQDPIAQLLDTGNFVLRGSNSRSEDYVWQSFDYPSDTLLPGMKLGWDSKTGLNRKLTSRKSQNDLSSGEFSYEVNLDGLPEIVVRKGNMTMFRGGAWFGNGFTRGRSKGGIFNYNSSFEISFSYTALTNDAYRAVLDSSGSVIYSVWSQEENRWRTTYTFEGSGCDDYDLCGSFGICSSGLVASCGCLDGFEQKSAQNYSDGCFRKDEKICRKGEGFRKMSDVKWPDSTGNLVKLKVGIKNCETECLNDCSCLAYGILSLPNIGPACATWFDKLLDIRFARDVGTGDDLFLREAASELEQSERKSTIVPVLVASISIFIFLALISLLIIRNVRRRAKADNGVTFTEGLIHESELEMSITRIEAATNNFSISNKIGEGGFGPVYKVLIYLLVLSATHREMKPKISDFGTARMFGEYQMETKTKRVIGT
uniref:Bulb-type lectin domain-containing protein n=1 Tax=Cucumis sativus TaxID=3659 RepID=A0A0A0LRS1_CUCSA